MNLCYRLARRRPYLNHVFQSNTNKHKMVSNLRGLSTSKHHEDIVAADLYNLRLRESQRYAASEEGIHVAEMKKLYKELTEKGIELSSTSYQIHIKSLLQKGALEGLVLATQICSECIPKPWFTDFFKSDPLTINTLLKRLYTSDFDEFQNLVEMLENQGLQPDAYHYKEMIFHLLHEERPEEAMEVYGKQSAKGIKFDSDTYDYLFQVLGCDKEKKNLDDIKRLYNDAHEKNVEFHKDCYETLIKVLSENEDFDAVLYIYDEYKRKIIPNHTFSDLCSITVQELCDKDRVDEAKAVFEWMVSMGMFPSEYPLMSLITMYCEDRCVEEIKWTFHKIREKGLCTDDYCSTEVLELISREGDPETARVADQFLRSGEDYHPIAIKQKRKILNLFLGIPEVDTEMESVYDKLPTRSL